MGHSSTTDRLDLPLFNDTDKPTWRGDWNLAMQLIDDASQRQELAYLRPKNFGVVGDNIADDTADMQECLNAGSVQFDQTTYYINGPLTFPVNSSQLGTGSGKTIFRLGPLGKIILGSITESNTDGGYGETKGITINGNDVSPTGFIVGNFAGRIVADIQVKACTGDSMVLRATQNCHFNNIKVIGGDYSIVLDNGCGGNLFTKCELYNFDVKGVDLRNSGDIPTLTVGSYYPAAYGNYDNTFFACLIELGTVNATHCIKIDRSSDNRFIKTSFTTGGMAENAAILEVNASNTANADYNSFDHCRFLGTPDNGHILVKANTGADSGFTRTFFSNCLGGGFDYVFSRNVFDNFVRDNCAFIADIDVVEQVGLAEDTYKFIGILGIDPTEWEPITTQSAIWDESDPPLIRAVGDVLEWRGTILSTNNVTVGVLDTILTEDFAIAPKNPAYFALASVVDGSSIFTVTFNANGSVVTNNTDPEGIFTRTTMFDGIRYQIAR